MKILFNKPYGVLSQFTPEAGHRALNEFGFPPNVYTAGRLDHDSEGALLLTDDGKLIKRLLDPKYEHFIISIAVIIACLNFVSKRKNKQKVDAVTSNAKKKGGILH